MTTAINDIAARALHAAQLDAVVEGPWLLSGTSYYRNVVVGTCKETPDVFYTAIVGVPDAGSDAVKIVGVDKFSTREEAAERADLSRKWSQKPGEMTQLDETPQLRNADQLTRVNVLGALPSYTPRDPMVPLPA